LFSRDVAVPHSQPSVTPRHFRRFLGSGRPEGHERSKITEFTLDQKHPPLASTALSRVGNGSIFNFFVFFFFEDVWHASSATSGHPFNRVAPENEAMFRGTFRIHI